MNLLKKICPICALVFITWVTMLGFRWQGYDVNGELIALLMGGSVVGISYLLGTRMNIPSRRGTMWKLVAIPIGFAAMYALLQFAWGYFMVAFITYALAYVFFKVSVVSADQEYVRDITKELDNCCE